MKNAATHNPKGIKMKTQSCCCQSSDIAEALDSFMPTPLSRQVSVPSNTSSLFSSFGTLRRHHPSRRRYRR